MVSPDESSWKISGQPQWPWAYATPSTVVYAIQHGRGQFPQAAAVLGLDNAGILVRDGWAPYRQFDRALHQTHLAHLLRRIREMATDYRRSAWPRCVQAVLEQGLAVRDRGDRCEISDHGVAVARGHLFKRLVALIHAPVRHVAVRASPRTCRPN